LRELHHITLLCLPGLKLFFFTAHRRGYRMETFHLSCIVATSGQFVSAAPAVFSFRARKDAAGAFQRLPVPWGVLCPSEHFSGAESITRLAKGNTHASSHSGPGRERPPGNIFAHCWKDGWATDLDSSSQGFASGCIFRPPVMLCGCDRTIRGADLCSQRGAPPNMSLSRNSPKTI
jgi:hypothetical protein